jgi:hypothetical protein
MERKTDGWESGFAAIHAFMLFVPFVVHPFSVRESKP